MKKIIPFCFLIIISTFSFGQHGKNFNVYWTLGYIGNDSLDNFSYKILQAISKEKIVAFDKDMKAMKKSQIEKSIPKDMLNPFTEKEIIIMLENGDFSCLENIETEFIEEDLKRMKKEGLDYMQYFRYPILKIAKPLEIKNLKVEIYEELVLDTSAGLQKGSIINIRLLIPGSYTISKESQLLCQVKYEDFKKLNLSPEQEILNQRKFVITNWDGDIKVVNGSEISTMSDICPRRQMPDKKILDQSVFRHFRKSIKLFDPNASEGGLSDY